MAMPSVAMRVPGSGQRGPASADQQEQPQAASRTPAQAASRRQAGGRSAGKWAAESAGWPALPQPPPEQERDRQGQEQKFGAGKAKHAERPFSGGKHVTSHDSTADRGQADAQRVVGVVAFVARTPTLRANPTIPCDGPAPVR